MSLKPRLHTLDGIFFDLLSTVASRPARRCTSYRFQQLLTHTQRTARRHASSTHSSKPPAASSTTSKTTTTSTSSTGLPPRPAAPTTPSSDASNIPLRMLLDRNPSNLSAISRIPIPRGERGEKFTPSPLSRPLGLPYPPLPGQNTPVDARTWSERRADLLRPSVIQERRRVLLRSFLRPYFQEWKRVNHHAGKSFVSNARLFRREKALWFPNLWGWTLREEGDGLDGGADTTPVLQGKVSVVGVKSGVWAEEQVETFLGGKEGQNPELKGLIEGSGGLVQRVDVNVQADWFRGLLVRLFRGRLRRLVERERWGKYFVVKLARDVGRGLTEDVRDAMGLLNSQVGYVYLLDADCRIRWAGSGHAWEGEVDGLNRGIRKLLEEARTGGKEARRDREREMAPLRRREGLKGLELEREIERALA